MIDLIKSLIFRSDDKPYVHGDYPFWHPQSGPTGGITCSFIIMITMAICAIVARALSN